MKKIFLLLPALGMMAFSSCSKQTTCPDEDLFSTLDQVRFSATISEATATRTTGNAWDAADAIGIYALQAGNQLAQANLHDGKANVKYTTTGVNGAFTAANDVISFPDNGNLDFIAYYPYVDTINGFSYPVDVTNQTDVSKIDVLYSHNVKGANKSKADVALVFDHALSALVLKVSAGDGITALTGLTARVEGLKVAGALNLVDGSVSASGDAVTFTPAVAAVDDHNATVSAIVVPGQNLSAAKVVLTLNGKVYEWVPTAQDLERTKKYTYMLQLTTSGVVQINPNATINDWNEGYKGTDNITLTPKEGVQFTVSNNSVSFAAKGALSEVINLTADAAQTWTAVSGDSWLTINKTSGTGPADITLTADENTANTQRTTTVTFTPAGHDPIEVTVTQDAAAAVTPPSSEGTLLAPGSNFEDFTAFKSGLNHYGLKDYATEAAGKGRNESKALHIEVTPSKNDYVFTMTVPENASFNGKTKIVLWVKGTASGKSFSFNVYTEDGEYTPFNLGVFSDDITLSPEAKNGYTGSIDTQGEWKKITLDISSLTLNTTAGESLFACKVGKKADWDVYIDDITIE